MNKDVWGAIIIHRMYACIMPYSLCNFMTGEIGKYMITFKVVGVILVALIVGLLSIIALYCSSFCYHLENRKHLCG